MTRKSPIKHKVRKHTRKGTKINSYTRGNGSQTKLANPKLSFQKTKITYSMKQNFLQKIQGVKKEINTIKNLLEKSKKGIFEKSTVNSLKKQLQDKKKYLNLLRNSSFEKYPYEYGITMNWLLNKEGEKFKKGDIVLAIRGVSEIDSNIDEDVIYINPNTPEQYDQIYTRVGLQVAKKRAAKVCRDISGGLSFMAQSGLCPTCQSSEQEAASLFSQQAKEFEK